MKNSKEILLRESKQEFADAALSIFGLGGATALSDSIITEAAHLSPLEMKKLSAKLECLTRKLSILNSYSAEQEQTAWTDKRVTALKFMWAAGKNHQQITKKLGGVTINGVIGKIHRLGLPSQATFLENSHSDEPEYNNEKTE